MDIKKAVKYVGDNFVYESDPKVLGDTWQVLKMKDGKFTGDCDDFSLTCFWFYSDKKLSKFLFHLLVTHRYKLYRCKTIYGEWHVIGSVDDLWFDNWTREALPKEQFFAKTKHDVKMRYLSFMFLWFLFMGLFK